MARRTLTRRDAVGTALAAGSLLLTGCAGKGSSPAVKQVQPDEVEPVEPAEPIEQTAEPDPADWTQVELDPAPTLSWTNSYGAERSNAPNDWHWCEGVLATSVSYVPLGSDTSGANCSFAAFDPVSGRLFEYLGVVAQPNEDYEDQPFVIATYGAERVSWLVYRVRQESDGLEPESTHVYAQRLDYETGELGERVELPDGDLGGWLDVTASVAASETRIGLYVAGGESNSMVSLASDGMVDVLLSDPLLDMLDDYASGTYAHAQIDPETGRDRLCSLDDGSALLESARYDDYEETLSTWTHEYMVRDAIRLSDGVFLTGCSDVGSLTYYVQGSEPVSLADQIEAQWEGTKVNLGLTYYVGQQRDGSVVLAGSGVLLRIGVGPTVEFLLDYDRFTALDAEVMGMDAVTGDIYLTTTDEQVIMSSVGEDVGRWTIFPRGAYYNSNHDETVVNTDVTQTEAVLGLEGDDEVTRAVVTRGGQPT